jgi:hypothetical protein
LTPLRRLVPLGASLAVALLVGGGSAHAATTGDVLVGFEPGTSASHRADARADAGARLVDVLPRSGVQVLAPRSGRTARAAIAELESRPDVAFAEPDRVRRAQALPADPLLANEWGLTQVGAPAAWDTTFGSPGVRVAVLDTGVSDDAPDLAPNLLPGQDFVGAGDADPDDADGHGTRVAGVLAARDDGAGLVGLAPHTSILPVRVLSADGTGVDSDIVEGLDWAVANGARVVNLSLAAPGWGEALHQAILRAAAQGVLVVTAAGNAAVDNDASRDVTYPCNDDSDNVICVAASDRLDQLATFSSFGATNVDLAAPGTEILTTDWFAPPANQRYAEDFQTPIAGRWQMTTTGDTTWAQDGGDYVATAGPGSSWPASSETYATSVLDLRRGQACTLAVDVTRRLIGGDYFRVRLVSQDGSLVSATNFLAATDAGPTRLTLPAAALAGRRDVRLTMRLVTEAGAGSDRYVRVHAVTLTCDPGPLAHTDTITTQGTSLAAPFVSAAAALVLGAGRAGSVPALRQRLLGTVAPVPGLAGRVATGGRLDAAAAVGAPTPPSQTPPPVTATPPATPGTPPPRESTPPSPGTPAKPATALLRAPKRVKATALRRGLAVRARLPGRGRLELWTAGRKGKRFARLALRGDGRTHAFRLRLSRRSRAALTRARPRALEVRLYAGSGPPLRTTVRLAR